MMLLEVGGVGPSMRFRRKPKPTHRPNVAKHRPERGTLRLLIWNVCNGWKAAISACPAKHPLAHYHCGGKCGAAYSYQEKQLSLKMIK